MSDRKTYIYVVLVRANTFLGRLARTLSHYEYTHIAFSEDPRRDEYITFSRRRHYAPFDAGFMRESLSCYAYGNYKRVKLKIYKLPVSPERLGVIREYISSVENGGYDFNIYSMVTMPVLHGFRIYKAHNCMSFVGKIIELSKAIPLARPYYKYSIKDIDNLLSPYEYREKFYSRKENDKQDPADSAYMERVSLVENAKMFISLNVRLLKKIFTHM